MNPRVCSRILGVFHSHCFWVRYRTHIDTQYAHAQTFIVTGVNPAAELFVQMEPTMGNRFLQNYRVPSFKIHTCSLHADIDTYSCSRNTYTHMFKTLVFSTNAVTHLPHQCLSCSEFNKTVSKLILCIFRQSMQYFF
jgi:hypothetical protein